MINNYSSRQISIAIVLLCWAISQFIAYAHFGVLKSVDSGVYIDGALSITQLNWPQKGAIFYSSYSFTIALLLTAGLNATCIIALQIVASALAILGIFRLTESLSDNNSAPMIACILYIVWFKFHQWSLIVYTDSLFTSAVVLSVFALHHANSKLSYAVACVLIVFTAFIRPTGVGFLIAILGHTLYDNVWLNKRSLAVRGLVMIVSLAACVVVLNGVLQNFADSFLQSYRKGEIIYPGITMGVEVPNNITLANETHPPLIQLITFLAENPIYMAKLCSIKAVLFLSHIKPYYSTGHNIWIAVILYPAYLFAIKGFIVSPTGKLSTFALLFIGFQILTVSLTSENWDGRFLLPVLPWVFIYASLGISSAFRKETEPFFSFLFGEKNNPHTL